MPWTDDDGAPQRGRVRRDDDTSTHKSYEVEKVTQTRVYKGERQYLVRWLGWESHYDVWIGEEELRRTAPLCLRDFAAGAIDQTRNRPRPGTTQLMASMPHTAEDQRAMCQGFCNAVDEAEICYRVPHSDDSGYAMYCGRCIVGIGETRITQYKHSGVCDVCYSRDGMWWLTDCGQAFHQDCLEKWPEQTCPSCRSDMGSLVTR